MVKARQARIVIDSIDGSMMASANGESGEIVDAMVGAMMQMCKQKPFMKRMFKRKMMREWLRESPLYYFVENLGELVIGIAVLTVVLYGFACVMHWLGA